jgi:hypothetical protein
MARPVEEATVPLAAGALRAMVNNPFHPPHAQVLPVSRRAAADPRRSLALRARRLVLRQPPAANRQGQLILIQPSPLELHREADRRAQAREAAHRQARRAVGRPPRPPRNNRVRRRPAATGEQGRQMDFGAKPPPRQSQGPSYFFSPISSATFGSIASAQIS